MSTPVKTTTSYSYLDTSGVSVPTGNQPFGTVGRNAGRGTRYNSTDLSLHKKLALGGSELRYRKFRAEAFNVLNHVNYGLPDSM